jgi:hypothetical protein
MSSLRHFAVCDACKVGCGHPVSSRWSSRTLQSFIFMTPLLHDLEVCLGVFPVNRLKFFLFGYRRAKY